MHTSNKLTAQKGTPTILTCNDVTKHYGELNVLKDVSFSLKKGEKIGLAGENGAGKSTLLKILSGAIASDAGNVTAQGQVGYIPQEIAESERAMRVEDLLQRDHTEDVSDKARSFCNRLMLSPDILHKELRTLSGGEKTKVSIMRILLAPYNIFLLDEPTNNLDLPALAFLEQFIANSDKAFIIVSHDRRFLDRTISKVVALDKDTREASIHAGTFTDYMEEKEAALKRKWAQYQDAQAEKKRLKMSAKEKEKKAYTTEKTKWTRDNDKSQTDFKKEKAAGKLHQARRVLNRRLAAMDEVEKPKRKLPLNIIFEEAERSGDKVLTCESLTKTRDNTIVGPIDLSVWYGEKVLVLGPNGAGKSTLIKMIVGDITPDAGISTLGARVAIGYLPQENEFDQDRTLLGAFLAKTDIEEGIGRRLLNRFGLTEDEVLRPFSEASPGERSRLIIATAMARKPNFLILDEPSNHLDLEVLTELEEALQEYGGTLLLVSHDRYFIDQVGITHTYILADGTLNPVTDYHTYEKRFMEE